MNKLYKATELAEILKISAKTVYKLANEGKIESYRIGKSVRFPMPDKWESEDEKQ